MKLTKQNKDNTEKEIEYVSGILKNNDYISYSNLRESTGINVSNFERIMRELTKRGKLIRIKRDLYVPKESNINEFRLGNILFNGYIGLESALYLHKIIDILPFTIYVMNSKSSKTYTFRNYTIKGFNTKNTKGTTIINNILLSTKTKTIYDCLKYNHSNKNILIKAILEFNLKETDEFIKYINNESNSFKQRVGFLLDMKNISTNTKRIINYCSKFVKNKVYLDKNGKYNNKWQVIA